MPDGNDVMNMQSAAYDLIETLQQAPFDTEDDGDFWSWTNKFWAVEKRFKLTLAAFIHNKQKAVQHDE